MGDFRKLVVWRRAKEIAVEMYKLTDEGIFSKDFGFKDQLRRAAVCSDFANLEDLQNLIHLFDPTLKIELSFLHTLFVLKK
ncbi:MAG TPA: four helix bundle protein [Saprospiraceae bacterium]|nr:four helix bundle protein [Saprospiraceae bacterium]HMP23651.1 four helix bundle protein [Saprospiraceae bacterium]